MMVDNGLINRFFLNQCTEEEGIAVAKYFEENPEALDVWLPLHLWENMNIVHNVKIISKRRTLFLVADGASSPIRG